MAMLATPLAAADGRRRRTSSRSVRSTRFRTRRVSVQVGKGILFPSHMREYAIDWTCPKKHPFTPPGAALSSKVRFVYQVGHDED